MFGGSVISMMLSSPPVCSAVSLISARPPNHQSASPSPLRVAIASSSCVCCVVIRPPVRIDVSRSRSEIAARQAPSPPRRSTWMPASAMTSAVSARLQHAPRARDVAAVASRERGERAADLRAAAGLQAAGRHQHRAVVEQGVEARAVTRHEGVLEQRLQLLGRSRSCCHGAEATQRSTPGPCQESGISVRPRRRPTVARHDRVRQGAGAPTGSPRWPGRDSTL